jgi:CheY-like chemotaxis protein
MVAKRIATALLVDEEPTSRSANQSRLEDDGYVVLVAQNETDALSRAQESTPTVIFVHLLATGHGSLSLIEALKADDACRHIPVVVINDHPDVRTMQAKLHAVRHEGW